MKQNEADRLAINLSLKFGLPIRALVKAGPEGQFVILEPDGIHPNEAFKIKIIVGWRSLFVELIFGKFAAELLQQMGESSKERKELFSNIAQEIKNEKGLLNFRINETQFDPVDFNDWPEQWKSLSFSLKKTPLQINTEDQALDEHLINLWTERFFGCVIAISPLEESLTEEEAKGLPEGTLTKISVNRYERSRFNRSLCINFHGTDCKVCGMNFGVVYGHLGENFIHVHHVTPVSRLGENYNINPIKDLIPVCPNCHAMLHKTEPPLSIEELREIVKV